MDGPVGAMAIAPHPRPIARGSLCPLRSKTDRRPSVALIGTIVEKDAFLGKNAP
jgi:hypothetical protein